MDHRETLKAIAKAIESKDLRALREFEGLFDRHHFKRMYEVLRGSRMEIRDCKLLDEYLVIRLAKNVDTDIAIVVMFDETTERFYVAMRQISSQSEVLSASDVRDWLGFDHDATQIDVTGEIGRYRVQGDLVIEVETPDLFAAELEVFLKHALEEEITNALAQRVASILGSLSLNVEVAGWRVSVPLPPYHRRGEQLMECLKRKVTELIEKRFDELLGDFVRFLSRAAGAPSAGASINVQDRDIVIRVESSGRIHGEMILRFLLEPVAIDVYVKIYIYEISALLDNIINKLKLEAHTLNIGNHTVTMTNSTGNLFTIVIELGLRERQKMMLEVRTSRILVRDSEMLIHHPEHGVKLFKVRGTKSIRFTTIANGFEEYVNKYILEELAREYEEKRRRER